MIRIRKHNVRGWAETLLRLCQFNRLPSLDRIDPEDYMVVGSLHPIVEYESPFNIYETLADGSGFALPRPLERYDIINIATSSPSRGVTSLLLVKLKSDMHLVYPSARMHYVKSRPFALLPLPAAMPFHRGLFDPGD
jgi:hypothetical protein